MANYFDQFDTPISQGATPTQTGNFFDQFDKPESEQQGDTAKGFKRAFAQIPELAYGAASLASMSAEHLFGEGGLSTAAKDYFGQKFAEKQQANQQYAPTVEFTDAWENLKSGDLGSMVDWLQDSAGYVAGQAIQTAVTGGIGAVVGKAGLSAATQKMLGGVVAKQAAKIAEESAGKIAMAEATKMAAQRTAQVLGAGIALQAQNLGMEAGDIYGGLTEESAKTGKPITGDDLLRAWGAAAAAAGTETATDLLGLGAVTGRLNIGKMTGLSGRAARAGVAAGVGMPIEAGQEYIQTGLEQYGAGKELGTPEAERERVNAAAVGGLGGAVVGGGAGLISSAQQPSTTSPPPRDPIADTLAPAAPILNAGTLDGAIQAAASVATQDTTIADAADRARSNSDAEAARASAEIEQGLISSAQNIPNMGTIVPNLGISPVDDTATVAPAGDTPAETITPKTVGGIPVSAQSVEQQAIPRTPEEIAAATTEHLDAAYRLARDPETRDNILRELEDRKNGIANLDQTGDSGRNAEARPSNVESGLSQGIRVESEKTGGTVDGRVVRGMREDLATTHTVTPEVVPKASTALGTAVAPLQNIVTSEQVPSNRNITPVSVPDEVTPDNVSQTAQNEPLRVINDTIAPSSVQKSAAFKENEQTAKVNTDRFAGAGKVIEVDKASAEVDKGPEVERFQGQYLHGMTERVANQQQKRLSSAKPQLVWTVEKTTDTVNPDRYDVVGRAINESSKSTAKAVEAQGITGAQAGEKQGMTGAKPRVVEESVQEKSEREAQENYGRVVGEADLSKVSTKDLFRAEGWGSRVVQNEKRKGWEGGPVKEDLIRSMEVDLGAMTKELRRRGEIGKPDIAPTAAQPAAPAQPTAPTPEGAPAPASQAPAGNWLESLPEEQKQAAYAAMREIDARAQQADKNERALRAPQGSIPVGSAGFDEFIRAEGPNEFLRGLRKGLTPEQAEAAAKVYAREAVAKHNAARKDRDWQRADMTGDSAIERARQNVESVIRPSQAAEAVKEPWQYTRREFDAKGLGKVSDETLSQAQELNLKVDAAARAMLDASGYWKYNKKGDLATRKSTIGALMEFEPHSVETALKSPKVARSLKDAYRTAKAEKDTLSQAADIEASHETAVRKALADGKPVPASVLADYPDLKQAEPAKEAAKAPVESGKPRMAETADGLYAAIKKAGSGVVSERHGILYPVIHMPAVGGTYRLEPDGSYVSIDNGGTTATPATKAQIADIEDAIATDTAQIDLMRHWGGSGRGTNYKVDSVLHSPSGNSWGQQRAAEPAKEVAKLTGDELINDKPAKPRTLTASQIPTDAEITLPVKVEETGEVHDVDFNARKAFKKSDRKVKRLQALLDCVKG